MKKVFYYIGITLIAAFGAGANCPASSSPFYQKYIVRSLPSDTELKIPKIIHQVWHVWDPKNPNPPADQQKWANEFKLLHPDWKYILWNEKSSEQLIAQKCPKILDLYKNYDKGAKRGDAIRYCILWSQGGVYADMSFQPIKNIEPLLKGADVVIAEQDIKDNPTVGTAFLASVPHHPFFNELMDRLPETKDRNTVEATGPLFLTESVNHYLKSNPQMAGFHILDRKFVYPYPWYEKESPHAIKCQNNPTSCASLFPDAFLVKHWFGSWLKQ